MKSLFRNLLGSATRPAGKIALDATARMQKAVARAFFAPLFDAPRPTARAPSTRPAAWTVDIPTTPEDDVGRRAPPSQEPTSSKTRTASFVEATATHAGLSRTFKLFVPADLGPRPSLVVMLHGCTQDADDFARGTRLNDWAERQGFIVLYPNQSRAANPAACWNWFRREDQRRGAGEAAFLAELTTATIARYGVDPRRVYVAGLSAGGAMAAILLAAYPDIFAAAAIHSGLAAGAAANLPDALTAMRRGRAHSRANDAASTTAAILPAIVFHGDADETVHPSNAEHVVASLFADGPPPGRTESGTSPSGQGYERTIYRDADGVDRVERWVLHAAGHAWAGGDATGSYTDPRGIDASREMLRFFAAQARR